MIHCSPRLFGSIMASDRWLIMECDQLGDEWRSKLDETRYRYLIERNPEDKQKFLKLLKQFSNAIMCGKVPPAND